MGGKVDHTRGFEDVVGRGLARCPQGPHGWPEPTADVQGGDEERVPVGLGKVAFGREVLRRRGWDVQEGGKARAEHYPVHEEGRLRLGREREDQAAMTFHREGLAAR